MPHKIHSSSLHILINKLWWLLLNLWIWSSVIDSNCSEKLHQNIIWSEQQFRGKVKSCWIGNTVNVLLDAPGRCIFRKGERLLRPKWPRLGQSVRWLKTPIMAHFYRLFNKDCVSCPFESWIFYKLRLSRNFYTQNIKQYLLFSKISLKIVSALKG